MLSYSKYAYLIRKSLDPGLNVAELSECYAVQDACGVSQSRTRHSRTAMGVLFFHPTTPQLTYMYSASAISRKHVVVGGA